MANQQELKQTVIQARKDVKKRSFSQSFELIVSFKDLDLKKQPLNLNEIVRLPNNFGKIPKICVFASGDLALRAEKVGVDDLFNEDELNVLSSQKRDVKKLEMKCNKVVKMMKEIASEYKKMHGGAPTSHDVLWNTFKDFEDIAYFEPYYLKDFVSRKKS